MGGVAGPAHFTQTRQVWTGTRRGMGGAMEESIGAGVLLSVITAALLVMVGWLQMPKGREPHLKWVGLAALAGLVTPVVITLADLPLYPLEQALAGQLRIFFISFLGAGVPEELGKGLAVAWVLARSRSSRPAALSPLHGLVYGLAVAVTFAVIENAFYIAAAEERDLTTFVRCVMSVPGHASFTAVMGYYLGLAECAPPQRRRALQLIGLLQAAFFHGLYDVFAFEQDEDGLEWLGWVDVPVLIGGSAYLQVLLLRAERQSRPRKRAAAPMVK